MTSSSQKGKLLKKNSIAPNKDPPEGRTTAIVAVMRGRPKYSHHCQGSNKHVVGLKRTERRNPVSVPPRKANIRVIP